MLPLLHPLSKFSTTLQTLTHNKSVLKMKTNFKTHRSHSQPVHTGTPSVKLLPYRHMSWHYLNNGYRELDIFRNKMMANRALAAGEDYEEYPLGKIINICLRLREEGNHDPTLWKKLQQRVQQLFRNTSTMQNIILFHLSISKFSHSLQTKLLAQLQAQLKSMTQLQRQLLFYSLCHLDYSNSPLSPKINILKQDIMSLVHKSKLTFGSLVQWILLVGIGSAGTLGGVLKYYDKVFLYDTNKHTIDVEHFCSLMRCLETRALLADDKMVQKVREKGSKLLELYHKKVGNSTALLNTNPQHMLLKTLLNYYSPNPTNLLTSQQFLNSNLDSTTKLQYLFWVWKNDLMQLYEIKSLYESELGAGMEAKGQGDGFGGIDLVYHCCWLEMAIGSYRNFGWIVQRVSKMEYVPNGLQWAVWNYMTYLTKTTSLTTQQKEDVQKVIKKIMSCSSLYDKSKKRATQQQNLSQSPEIKQIVKFFHSIKAWPFKECQTIGDLDYIAHFVNQEAKIIVHCLMKQDFIQLSTEEKGSDKQKMINNRHILDKKLLKENFGFEVIDLETDHFLKMGYGERIQWLRQMIASRRNPEKYIQK